MISALIGLCNRTVCVMPKYLIRGHMPWCTGAHELGLFYDCHILLHAKRAHKEILIRALIILKKYPVKPLLGQKEVQPPPVLLL